MGCPHYAAPHYDDAMRTRPRIGVVPTIIPGCVELRPTVTRDTRGFFAKVFPFPSWETFVKTGASRSWS